MTKKILGGIAVFMSVLVGWVLIAPIAGCSSINTEYTSSLRPDGGVSLHITGTKRYWMPLTPEGPFPKQRLDFAVEVIGTGKDWSYRGQDGFYYETENIKCKNEHWDIGYAWIDKERQYIYFNLYWVSAPNKLEPSDINGKYKTTQPVSSGDSATRIAPEK